MAKTKPEQPPIYIYASIMERPSNCSCSWVWDYRKETFKLKGRNTLCPAVLWHLAKESETVNGT